MPRPVQYDGLSCLELSLAFRRSYWTRHPDEPDAGLLWPGMRSLLSQGLAGGLSRVFGAVSEGPSPLVASRVIFSRSPTRRDVWYYGNFSTHPDFRRQGLGERALAAGLEALARDGAQGCGCFIADDNLPSAALARKLGFRRLPVVRIALASDSWQGDPARADQLTPVVGQGAAGHPRWLPLLQGLGIAETEASVVLADELNRLRPLLPWRQTPDRLMLLAHDSGSAAFMRVGAHATVVVLGTGLADHEQGWLVATAVHLAGPRRPLFVFGARQDLAGWMAPASSARAFDIYWKALR